MPKDLTQAEALREAIGEEMRRDPSVFVMGEDVGRMGGIFTVTRGLVEEFGPEQVRDTPIPFSPPLEDFVIPQESDLESAVRRALDGTP